MSVLLSQSVKDLRGKVLCAAGKDVKEWALKTVMPQDYIKSKSKFRDNGQLLEDLQSVFTMEPYDRVLKGWTTDLKEWIGEGWVPSICFEELRLLRNRDPYHYRHLMVVTVVGSRLLEQWIKTQATLRRAFAAFLFHDLGKSRLETVILEKTESLDDVERRMIREHPLISFVLNASYWGDANHLCAEVALQQNENRLGTGYPYGTKSNSLILDILSLLDRFDAMISDRPFRFKKFTVREALDVLATDAFYGTYDVEVLKGIVGLLRKEQLKDLKKMKFGTVGRKSEKA